MRKLFLSSSFNDVSKLLYANFGDIFKGRSVTFISTAALYEKVNFYVSSGEKALERLGMIVDKLEVSTAPISEILAKLQQNDYIYVSGGNTFFLLQELKKSGADSVIIEQINSGKLYIGESAGSIVCSPNIEYIKWMDDYKIAKDLIDYTGLGVIDFYTVPHHNNLPFKKVAETIVSAYAEVLPLKPISNSQVMLVIGDTIKILE